MTTPPLSHPPHPPISSLLSIRLTPLSKYLRRHAHLSRSILTLYTPTTTTTTSSTSTTCTASATPSFAASLINTTIHPHHSTLTLTLTRGASRELLPLTLKLRLPTRARFHQWHYALLSASAWTLDNHYKLHRDAVLGRGSFAVVHEGLDLKLLRPVAIKHIPIPHDAQTVDEAHAAYLADRQQRELRFAAVLRHPNIVSVYDVFLSPVAASVVMEPLSYTLSDLLLANVSLSEQATAQILRHILSALAYLHAQNVAHRDLNPQNVLLDTLVPPCVAKIADFGMATVPPPRRVPRSVPLPKRLRPLPLSVGGKRGGKMREDKAEAVHGKEAGARLLDEQYDACDLHMGFVNPVNLAPYASFGKNLAGLSYHNPRRTGLHVHNLRRPPVISNTTTTTTTSVIPRTAIDGQTLSSHIGAPSYVAPELVHGKHYGKEVDLWAVGVMAFFMLTGYLPFEGPTVDVVLNKIAKGKVEWNQGVWGRISNDAVVFVKGLLQKDPMRRTTAAAALQSKWLKKWDESESESEVK